MTKANFVPLREHFITFTILNAQTGAENLEQCMKVNVLILLLQLEVSRPCSQNNM